MVLADQISEKLTDENRNSQNIITVTDQSCPSTLFDKEKDILANISQLVNFTDLELRVAEKGMPHGLLNSDMQAYEPENMQTEESVGFTIIPEDEDEYL